MILEGLYKSKVQDSVELQTVLALYNQETFQNNGETSYLRLKASLQLHIDQMMRTRKFRVWSDVVERRSVTKSQKRKERLRREESGRVFSVRGQCSKGDSCSFSHDQIASGNSGGGQRRKRRSSAPAPNLKGKADGEEGNRVEISNKKQSDSVPVQDLLVSVM